MDYPIPLKTKKGIFRFPNFNIFKFKSKKKISIKYQKSDSELFIIQPDILDVGKEDIIYSNTTKRIIYSNSTKKKGMPYN